MRATIFALVLIAAACATQQSSEELPLVCRVSADRAAFAGQMVTLEGRISTDFHHGSGVAHDNCPEAYVPLGREMPDAPGKQSFFEAWYAARSCPEEPLFVTITGIMEPTEDRGRTFLALTVSEYHDIRRAPGSDCPMTLRDLHERLS